MTTEAPELTAAKLWREVIRRRSARDSTGLRLVEAQSDHADAIANYEATMAAYQEAKGDQ